MLATTRVAKLHVHEHNNEQMIGNCNEMLTHFRIKAFYIDCFFPNFLMLIANLCYFSKNGTFLKLVLLPFSF